MLLFVGALLVHCLVVVECQWPSAVNKNDVTHINASFDKEYPVNVSKETYYTLAYIATANTSVGIRIRMSAPSATKQLPVNVVLWEDEGVLSWRLPWIVEDNDQRRYSYTTVVKTICSSTQTNEPEHMSVYLSTLSVNPINTTIELQLVPIELSLNAKLDVTTEPAQPVYKRFTIPDGVDSVVVYVEADDEDDSQVCMVMSVQDSVCPVYDLMRNVAYIGSYQTVTKKGAITVPRSEFANASFFVVLVVQANDDECMLDVQPLHKLDPDTVGSQSAVRQKNVSILIKEGLQPHKYLGPTLGAACVFLVLALTLCLLYWGLINIIQLFNQIPSGTTAGPDMDSTELTLYDRIPQDDSATKAERKNYPLNLLAVFIYYGIPVWQLVTTYTVFTKVTGNEDSCYYNFDCVRPLGRLKAFNNVYSNIGYIIMGLAFICLVTGRKYLRRNQKTDLGIPTNYGLLYSIGLGLCIEGVMSASFHVCPNYAIFQFDTSYMYMISWLCMLKLYQNRHPSLLIGAATAYLTIALFVLLAVIGVLYGQEILPFWIIFGIVHILTSFFLTNLVCLYQQTDGNVFSGLIKGLKDTDQPKYVWRVVSMGTVTGINVIIAVWGMVDPRFFASQLLYICVVNFVLYMAYYICMKMAYKEQVLADGLIGVLAVVMWIVSLYYFTSAVTDWKLSPASSRETNEECELFDFYDKHDIWHFCSAISLFMSFCFLLAVDDDLTHVDRKQIPVF